MRRLDSTGWLYQTPDIGCLNDFTFCSIEFHVTNGGHVGLVMSGLGLAAKINLKCVLVPVE
jgi:hypothetical protein